MIFYYDKQGEPLGMFEAERLLNDPSYRQVARDEVGRYVISTVWLCIPSNIGSSEPPQIFETAVFTAGELLDIYGRSSTLQEAEATHRQAVETYKTGRPR